MENENLVTEEVTENTEETVEETGEVLTDNEENGEEQKGKYYTDEELDTLLSERYNRGRKKGERESRQKYGRLESILKAGLEVDNLNDAEKKLTEFYQEQGINIPKADFDDEDIKVLATKDAEDIIAGGDGAVESELKRLSDLGTGKMSKREKAMFETLYNAHTQAKERKELAEIGVKADILDSKEFKEFTQKLNPKLPAKEKYELYEKMMPKEEAKQMGSMVNTSKQNTVKEFYTYEEASKFTRKDLDNSPELVKAIENSMSKWK